jgi:acyl carrier protein
MEILERGEITQKVKSILAESLNLSEDRVTLESRLIEDLEVESVDMIALLLEFEECFGREIPNKDLRNLTTVDAIVNYIASQR